MSRKRQINEAARVARQLWCNPKVQPFRANEKCALFVGDATDMLAGMPSGSVNTCVTSPPYWGVRDYQQDGQLGNEDSVEEYISRLVAVFEEVKRVLHPAGTVWLNVGDKYLNGVSTVNGKPPERGWQRNKQLSLVPFRLAIALQDKGWWVRNAVVWNKPNAMPISATDRLTNAWEPVFLLTKSERYYFDLDAIRVAHKTSDAIERKRAERGAVQGKAAGQEQLRRWLNSPRHRATIDGVKEIGRRPNAPEAVELAGYLREALKRNGKTIHEVAEALGQPFERVRHYFRTDVIGSRLPPDETWASLQQLLTLDGAYDEAMTIEYGDNVFRNHPKGRNPGDMQSFGVSTSPGQHFAMMPIALAEWCLAATLPRDGVCLDPFMGLGTTGKAASKQNGFFVGIDIVEEYVLDYFSQSNMNDERTIREAAE